MGFFSKVFKVAKKVAPVALMAFPGAGTALGAALGAGAAFAPAVGSAVLGAGLGATGGGGLKGALLGGAGGALGAAGGAAGTLAGKGSVAGNFLARQGLSTGAQTLGGVASGALTGASTGGKTGALIGGLSGGILANKDNIYNSINGGLSDSGNYARSLAGIDPSSEYLLNAPSTMSSETQANLLGAGYSQNQLNGMLSGGSVKSAPLLGNSDTQSAANSQGGGSSMFGGSKLSDILSGAYNLDTTNKNEDELLKAQREAQGYMNPYYKAGTEAMTNLQGRLNTGFNPGDLTTDPGYQFQLEQGNKNLNRSLGAQGSLFSGRALKAAQDYGQGLAEQTYQNAYNRWLQQNNQLAGLSNTGYNSGTQLGDMATTYGSTKANANNARNNTITGLSSMLLGGRIIGWDKYGSPIYEGQGRDEQVVM